MGIIFSGCGKSSESSESPEISQEMNEQSEKKGTDDLDEHEETSEEKNKEGVYTEFSGTVKIVSFFWTQNNTMMPGATASGTLVSEDGFIVTNSHVVTNPYDENYDGFAICIPENNTKKPPCLYTASLVTKDKTKDFALLHIDSQNIFGEDAPKFSFLEWENTKNPEVKEEVLVTGFPTIGGDTVTSTNGKVSGFEEREGVMFFKTDAKVDNGNSGGTAKNKAGRFIGIPSFIKKGNETLGYILPLAQVQKEIQEKISQSVPGALKTQEILRNFLKIEYEAEKNRKFVSQVYPFFSFEIEEKWNIDMADTVNLILSSEVEGKEVLFSFSAGRTSFDLPDEVMQRQLDMMRKSKYLVENFEEKEAEQMGKKGVEISFEREGVRTLLFVGQENHANFFYSYHFPIEVKEKAMEKYQALMNGVSLESEKTESEIPQGEYLSTRPYLFLKESGGVSFSSTDSQFEESTVIVFDSRESIKMEAEVEYLFLTKSFWGLSNEEIFEELKKTYSASYALSNVYPLVVIDGKKGFGLEYTTQGDDEKEQRTNLELFFPDEIKKSLLGFSSQKRKKTFRITLSDIQERYPDDVEDLREILLSMRFSDAEISGEYNVPLFRPAFNDLERHLYELEIKSLSAQEIIPRGVDSFFPENKITTGDFIDWVVASKVFVEKMRGEDALKKDLERASSFAFAQKNGWVSASDNTTSLLVLDNAVMILFKAYSVPVWNPPYQVSEKYKSYVTAKSDGVIFYEHWPATRILSRGEAAAIIYYFIVNVIEIEDF